MDSPALPRPSPIVHIGYHKTATTWFQKHVFPTAGTHRFISRKVTQSALLAAPGLHFCRENAGRILSEGDDGRPPILSEENLSGYLHNGGLHGMVGPEMARRIKQVLPDARILIFIRNQNDVLRASYAQYVSGGGTWAMPRYFLTAQSVQGALTRPWKAPAFQFEHFEFDRLVAHYDQLFGRERVHVYPYEWLREPTRLLQRMQVDLGIALDCEDCLKKQANGSLGPFGLWLLRKVNLFTRQSVVNKDCVLDLPGGQGLRHGAKAMLSFSKKGGRSVRLPQAVRERVAHHYAPSNKRLLALRDLPLEEFAYPL